MDVKVNACCNRLLLKIPVCMGVRSEVLAADNGRNRARVYRHVRNIATLPSQDVCLLIYVCFQLIIAACIVLLINSCNVVRSRGG